VIRRGSWRPANRAGGSIRSGERLIEAYSGSGRGWVSAASRRRGAHFRRVMLYTVCARRAPDPCIFYKYAPVRKAERRLLIEVIASAGLFRLEHSASQFAIVAVGLGRHQISGLAQ
jgi:hypothetical protein